MTRAPGIPRQQAETLCQVIAARVPNVAGVAHLCTGWRDLAAHLTEAVDLPSTGKVHRADGVRVAIDHGQARVRVALALQWPHRAETVCQDIRATAADAANHVVGVTSCQVHVAIRDVHLPTCGDQRR